MGTALAVAPVVSLSQLQQCVNGPNTPPPAVPPTATLSTRFQLSDDVFTDRPDVAAWLGRGGAAWLESDGSGGWKAKVARLSGGTFHTEELLGAHHPDSAYGPSVGVDQAGELTVAYSDGSGIVIQRGEVTASLGSKETPFVAGSAGDYAPALRVNPQGDAVLAWLRSVPVAAAGEPMVSTRRGGVWQPEHWLRAQTNLDARIPRVAIAPEGTAAAGFVLVNGGCVAGACSFQPHEHFFARFAAGGGLLDFGRTQTLDAPVNEPRGLGVGVFPDATLLTVYQQNGHARTLERGVFSGPWTPPASLDTGPGANVTLPVTRVASDGTAVAAWMVQVSAAPLSYRVDARLRPKGGSWLPQVSLSAAGESASYPVVAAHDGRAVLAYYSRIGVADRIVVRLGSSAGWSLPLVLGSCPDVTTGTCGHGGAIAVDFDPNGSAYVVYSERKTGELGRRMWAVRID